MSASLVSVTELTRAGYLTAIDRRFAELCGRGAKSAEVRDLCEVLAGCTSRALRQGNPCFVLPEADQRALVGDDGEVFGELPSVEAVRTALREVDSVTHVEETTGATPLSTPLVLDAAGRLYLARYFDHELRLAERLANLVQKPPEDVDADWLNSRLDHYFADTSGQHAQQNGQRVAASRALRNRLCVISGGPGTGKTSTVVKVLALLIELATRTGRATPRIALLAPTGKAAARMVEAISGATQRLKFPEGVVEHIPLSAATIHRALGRNPQNATRFLRGPKRPLLADVVLVDEASMVDLQLMRHLVSALSPDCRLILLGDRHQLASVEAGSVLSEISEALTRESSLVELKKSYRFSEESGIFKLSAAIKGGDDDDAVEILRGSLDDLRFCEIQEDDTNSKSVVQKALMKHLKPLVLHHFGAALRERDPIEALLGFTQFRVLCAHREGIFGVSVQNEWARNWLVKEGSLPPSGQFYRGRPVLVTRNDYGVGLSNGDVGICWPNSSGAMSVYFLTSDGRTKVLSPHQLPEHETAFALTVHKSQGSEYGEVAVLLPPPQSPLLTRELLYTGVTRARKRATLLTSVSSVRTACRRTVARQSGLGARISQLLEAASRRPLA